MPKPILNPGSVIVPMDRLRVSVPIGAATLDHPVILMTDPVIFLTADEARELARDLRLALALVAEFKRSHEESLTAGKPAEESPSGAY